MPAMRFAHLVGLVAGLALLAAPVQATADGDPASDVLLVSNVFYPYQQTVSNDLIAALNTATARAHAAKFPIRVAIIATPVDLGAVPDLFAKPQDYANFLEREISFNSRPVLLVVMQSGFGLANSGPSSALAGLRIPTERGSDGLATAAIKAVGLLAAASGHPIVLPPIPAGGAASTGSSAFVTFVAPAALVLVVVAIVAFTRPSRPSPKVDEIEQEPPGGSE
ncbi:MAG TPA: hypothetical protein VIJ51_14340 [Solirubrobacteraceae bacterium]